MAWISESFSGTSEGWLVPLSSDAFASEEDARSHAGSQIANDYADTVKVYEEWSEAIDSDGPENTLEDK